MHTFTYGMPPKRLPTSTNHQNAYQLQIRLPAYHMLTCLPAYHISRGHKRLPAYLLTTCPVATDHSNAKNLRVPRPSGHFHIDGWVGDGWVGDG